MGDQVMAAKEDMHKYIEQMKKGEIDAAQFYKDMMNVLATLDVTNDDLKGATPMLLNFVNTLLKNMSK